MRRILLLTLFTFFLSQTECFADKYIKREVRGAWIATVYGIDWPTTTGTSLTTSKAQQKEMNNYLDILQQSGINAIYFQVRPMADALYKSSYEPWSSYLTGRRGSKPYSTYDPLTFVVEECHKRGMECHAWVNPYRWCATATDWTTAQDKAVKDAGMIISYTNGSGTTTQIFNPALPATNERIVNVCKELLTNYDIDGIIFDDYFYPSGMPANSSAEDYKDYKAAGTSKSMADWRRANVNEMVKQVYEMIQQENPCVKFGISPAGVSCSDAAVAASHGVDRCEYGSDWQYNGIFSDPVAWLQAGTIDYISPQLYWKTDHATNKFGPLTQWWSKVAKKFGRHHYASHSLTALQSSNTNTDWVEYGKQVQYSRLYTQNQAPGAIFYSACDIDGKAVSGFGTWLANNKFQHPSLPPAISWKNHEELGKVTNLHVDNGKILWDAVDKNRYTIYAIPDEVEHSTIETSTTGGILADYLLGAFYENEFTIPEEYLQGYHFAVCIMDRFSNEYAPLYTNEASAINTLEDNGINIEFSDWQLRFNCTADEVRVVNLMGMEVAADCYCTSLSLSGYPSGFYIVQVRAGRQTAIKKIYIR